MSSGRDLAKASGRRNRFAVLGSLVQRRLEKCADDGPGGLLLFVVGQERSAIEKEPVVDTEISESPALIELSVVGPMEVAERLEFTGFHRVRPYWAKTVERADVSIHATVDGQIGGTPEPRLRTAGAVEAMKELWPRRRQCRRPTGSGRCDHCRDRTTRSASM